MRSSAEIPQDKIVTREVRPGLTVSFCDYVSRCDEPISVEVDSSLYFGIVARGMESSLKVNGATCFDIRPQCPVMLAFGERVDCMGEQKAGVRNTNMSVRMDLEFVRSLVNTYNAEVFDKILRRIEHDVSMHQLAQSCHFLTLVDSVLNCPFSDGLADIHLESCALALIAEVGRMLTDSQSCTETGDLMPRELERVQRVRELLEANIVNPLSLGELSREVGINPTTMSAHFRKVYGDTIFSFLRKNRLQMAQSMLRRRDIQISQVGYQVGFSNPAAFATAYRRHFGYPPSAEQRFAS